VLEHAHGGPNEVTGRSSARCSKTSAACAQWCSSPCEGGRGSHVGSFAGVASSLVEYGIPAVVEMRFEISDEAAITFAGRPYSAIAQGFPIDAAMAAVASDAQAVVTLNRNQTSTPPPPLRPGFRTNSR